MVYGRRRPIKKFNRSGVTGKMRRRVFKKNKGGKTPLSQRVTQLYSMIETKEGSQRITNLQLAHNNLIVLSNSAATPFNPFESGFGTGDPMNNNMQRIGDSITVSKLVIKFFIETSLNRNNTHFRFLFVKMAKGDTLSRATLFKGACDNKMIDQINTERFTILASKTVRVQQVANVAPSTISAITGVGTSTSIGIGATRIVSMVIPGRKFGRRGVVQYENGNGTQVKFYDYRLCCVAYDWYGTPQDVNNVGFINDGYSKLYFKDA